MVRRCLKQKSTYWLIHQKALPEGTKIILLEKTKEACNLKIIILLRICLNQTFMTLGKSSRKFPCLNMGRLLWEIPEISPNFRRSSRGGWWVDEAVRNLSADRCWTLWWHDLHEGLPLLFLVIEWIEKKKGGIMANHAERMLRFLGAEVAEAKHNTHTFSSSSLEHLLSYHMLNLYQTSIDPKHWNPDHLGAVGWRRFRERNFQPPDPPDPSWKPPKPETRNGRVISRKQLKPLRPKWFLDFAQLWGVSK